MRPIALQALTWATVVAAVVSALWLAAVEAEQRQVSRSRAAPPAVPPSTWSVERAVAADAGRRRADDAATGRQPATR
jgi:hypothetical protein